MKPPLKFFFLAALVFVALPAAGRAQTPPASGPVTLEETVAEGTPKTEKFPMISIGSPAYREHQVLLSRLYTRDLLETLADHFDRTVPGGFPARLAHARQAGVPDALLAEIEVMQATFDVNFPALTAAQARLEAARANWQETASLLPTRQEFDAFLGIIRYTVNLERVSPGSFAHTAMQSRKREIARAVYRDLRQVEAGTNIYAIKQHARSGEPVPVDAWLGEVRQVTPHSHLAINRGTDVTGQLIGLQTYGVPPSVPAATYRAVADAVPDDFWNPFRLPQGTPASTAPANP